MPTSLSDSLLRQALARGCDLVLEIFQTWRRGLDCTDALLLLAITRSNVDGILYSQELRARYGGPNPIAPDSLRQPVSPDIVAYSLGLAPTIVGRRLRRLAERDECVFTPNGLLISELQVEATGRLQIVSAVYQLLGKAYADLRALGFFERLPLPPLDVAEPGASTIRPAGAHAAKYVLRLLGTTARRTGDMVDALIWLQLWRSGSPGGASSIPATAATLGLSSDTFSRRLARLVSEGLCERRGRGSIAVADEPEWMALLAESNVAHAFQLFSGLAEVGALADFEMHEGGRPTPQG